MNTDLVVIIMAGGLGTRMESNIPKVIHKLDGVPLINHILTNLKNLSQLVNIKQILIVVGKYKDQIKEVIEKNIIIDNITYVDQLQALGTGHAIKCCLNELDKYKSSNTLILSGDVPLFSVNSMYNLINNVNKARITITTINDPKGYGRIKIEEGKFMKIIEHNDCTNDELNIVKINCGIYVFDTEILCKCVPYINNNNNKKEYYLTDIVEIIKSKEHINIELYEVLEEKQIEVIGINTKSQLNDLEKLMKKNM
jgi:UDP-N-acetylglucosamine diphosphorylase/glucosamine-1-phosphate N-acetyltransferase